MRIYEEIENQKKIVNDLMEATLLDAEFPSDSKLYPELMRESQKLDKLLSKSYAR